MESNKADSQLAAPPPQPQSQAPPPPAPQPQPPPQSQPSQQPPPPPPSQQQQQQPQQATPQLQHQPQPQQQVQAPVQAQQLMAPQLAPQLQTPQQTQQLAPSSQPVVAVVTAAMSAAAVSTSQLTQPPTSIQPACSVATSSTVVVPQIGQGPRGPNSQIRPHAEFLGNELWPPISNKPNPTIPNALNATTTHPALAPTTQSTPIQLQAPIQTLVPSSIPTVPVTAHQQPTTGVQPTFISRPPPTTLPIVPVPKSPTVVQPNLNKYVCCLLDNGVRCDRDAGNASFNARIQKLVGTRKMNFILDSTVRHAYICDHHKGIITLAKKSAPNTLARDTKANARNHNANSNANNLVSQPHPRLDYDFSMRQQQQQSLQNSGNLDLLNNQNRLANNHTGALNNMPVRQGAHLAYGHFQGSHTNQLGFDGGGDSLPSSSGGVDVDLQQLQVNTLRRYKRHFRVPTRPGLNKMQLAESLKSHFRTLPIIEKEAITYFVYIVKCYRNKLDHNPKAD